MVEKQGNRLLVSGAMTMPNVNALLAAATPMLVEPELELDLDRVTEVDSSAVSLLFEWLRQAHNRKVAITFSNMPANLASLASLYGVDHLIPH